VISCTFDQSKSSINNWIQLINLLIVTLIVNNVFTIILIVFVLKSRNNINKQRSKPINKAEEKEKKKALRDRKFAVNSIMLNVTCFFLKMPLLITNLIYTYVSVDPDLRQMVFTICVTIFVMDNASSFFVNILFNSLFSKEFLAVIRLRNEQSRNESSQTNFSRRRSKQASIFV
jgi:hypothetical protein